MVTSLKSSAIAILTATLLSSTAFAADVYTGDKSLKNDKNYASSGAVHNWSGWYLTGKLGVAKQDYDVRRSSSGEAGDIDPGVDSTVELPTFVDDPKFGWTGGSAFSLDSDDNLDAELELSYRQRLGRFILEPYVAGSLPLGGDPVRKAVGYDLTILDSNGLPDGTSSVTSIFEAEKRGDVSVGLKGGITPTDRLYLYAGAGLNIGFFKLKGAGDETNPSLLDSADVSRTALSWNESETAIGYELKLGAQYSIDSRTSFGVEGKWADWGSLDVGASRRSELDNCPEYVISGGRDKLDVSEFSIKGTLSYKLSD